jgi:hypothetical protein
METFVKQKMELRWNLLPPFLSNEHDTAWILDQKSSNAAYGQQWKNHIFILLLA